MANSDPSDLISQFVAITGASQEDAQQHLVANNFDLETSVTEYYTSQEEAETEPERDPAIGPPVDLFPRPEDYTGPRTLDGRPAPQSAASAASSSAKRPPPKKTGGINTLGSIASGSGSHAGHGHAHDDDDDDDDSDFTDDEQPRDLFAGGEKSGLAVQDPSRKDKNPRKIVKDLIKKAQAAGPQQERAGPAPPSRFSGSGQTLGGDGEESRRIEDPSGPVRPSAEIVNRTLHLWADGFSIDDGPLHSFDDPREAANLSMINSGRAPLHLMNVRRDQEVDVTLERHGEAWKPTPKKYTPFGGGGQRLGSPVPGVASASATVESTPASAQAAQTSSSSNTQPQIDDSQPTLSLRIQLADGRRLPARFNTTQTIGDLYDFVRAAAPGGSGRAWVIATTFPSKDHTDKDQVLGEMAEFKKGGTAVQKWT